MVINSRVIRLDIFGDAQKALGGAWDYVVQNVINPIFGWIQWLIGVTATAIGNATSSLIKTISDTLNAIISAPVGAIIDTWNTASASLKAALGPFGFAAPLVMTLVFAGCAVIVYYIVKWMVPGI